MCPSSGGAPRRPPLPQVSSLAGEGFGQPRLVADVEPCAAPALACEAEILFLDFLFFWGVVFVVVVVVLFSFGFFFYTIHECRRRWAPPPLLRAGGFYITRRAVTKSNHGFTGVD